MITIHRIDGDRKSCDVADHQGSVVYIHRGLSWKLVSKLQEKRRSEKERELYEPFSFMPQEVVK